MMETASQHNSINTLEFDQRSPYCGPRANSSQLFLCGPQAKKSFTFVNDWGESQKKSNILMERFVICSVRVSVFGYISSFNLYNNPVK